MLRSLQLLSMVFGIIRCYVVCMRTTLAMDDEIVDLAQEFTGITEKTALVREALKALIERESARRLADLGGTSPRLEPSSRRRAG